MIFFVAMHSKNFKGLKKKKRSPEEFKFCLNQNLSKLLH